MKILSRDFARALWLLLLSGCADLEPIPAGECGNNIVDEGEDCDSFDRLGMVCRAPGAEGQCRFDCSNDNACAPGYACGRDAICRAPSGRFEPRAELDHSAYFVVLGDFDADGETDLLASGQRGLAVSYQAGNFEEAGALSPTFAPPRSVIAGGHLTDGQATDVAYLGDGGLGVARGSEGRSFGGTVYPTLEVPEATAYFFAFEADASWAGDAAVKVSDVPELGTMVVLEGTSTFALPGTYLSDPGILPALRASSTVELRAGRLDPSKPCEQYVLTLEGQAFVGTPCLEDGRINGEYTFDGGPPLAPLPIPLVPVDLEQCAFELDRAFVIDVDDDAALDVVLVPRGPIGAAPCLVRGPLSLPEGASTTFSAEPYPIFLLEEHYSDDDTTEPERILEMADLNGDGVPDLVTSLSTFTSQAGPCAWNLWTHAGAESPAYCSSSPDDLDLERIYVSAALGDLNADGKVDVALAARDERQVLLHLGDGDGTFAVYALQAEGRPDHLVLGDFDADGVDDLMFADRTEAGDTLSIAFGHVSGGPEQPRNLGYVPRIEGLIRGKFPDTFQGIDAALDAGVLARDPDDDTLSFAILHGDTRRELQAPFYLTKSRKRPDEGAVPDEPLTLALGRFVEADGDGAPMVTTSDDQHQDLAVITLGFYSFGDNGPSEEPELGLWLVDAEGEARLSPSRAWPSAEPVGAARSEEVFLSTAVAGDLDGDAADEVVYAYHESLVIADVIMAGAHPAFDHHTLETGVVVRSTARIPRDLWASVEPVPAGAVPVPLQLGDLDGDGQRDIVVVGEAEGGAARLLVLWNDGGAFASDHSAAIELPPNTSAFLLLNLDADPGLEILVAAGGALSAYDVADRQLLELEVVTGVGEGGPEIMTLASADLDRDGVPDLVLGYAESMRLLRGLPRNPSDD